MIPTARSWSFVSPSKAGGLGLPIAVLGAAQFVMVLDSSVMNVSISQIVDDLDTTIAGVQLAITAYGDAQLQGLKRAIGAVAIFALLALWFTRGLPGRALAPTPRATTEVPEPA